MRAKDFWDDKIESLKQKNDLGNFYKWGEITSTMVANCNESEFEYLKNSSRWEKWEIKLTEDKLQPNKYFKFPKSSTNNIHHAYSLEKLMDWTKKELSDFNEIFEFGGGYGNMCRLFKLFGHNKKYVIYDFEQINKIQKYYLDINNINNYELQNTNITIDFNPSLYLAMWSLTETPIDVRDKILNDSNFFNSEIILLGLANNFKGEDNLKWLEENIIPKLENLNYTCFFEKTIFMNNNSYFLAYKQ